jgi:hypothetical protein
MKPENRSMPKDIYLRESAFICVRKKSFLIVFPAPFADFSRRGGRSLGNLKYDKVELTHWLEGSCLLII